VSHVTYPAFASKRRDMFNYIYTCNKTYRHEVSVLNKDTILFYFNGKLQITNHSVHIKMSI
jgi:hypothetical protein